MSLLLWSRDSSLITFRVDFVVGLKHSLAVLMALLATDCRLYSCMHSVELYTGQSPITTVSTTKFVRKIVRVSYKIGKFLFFGGKKLQR